MSIPCAKSHIQIFCGVHEYRVHNKAVLALFTWSSPQDMT